MSPKRLSGKQALAAWPERLAAVADEPTDDALQRLCTLLDAVDRWVVDRWQAAGHDERVATLAGCRNDAREANRLVSDALREAGRRRAEETNRKRARIGPSDVAVGAPGARWGARPQEGPTAA
ncbi:MAG TPA: hypothetical protein VK988_02560 [Acidimicrobiales bacterium]|nr:hypothetical protein [Acidimicrobiales bacterium]